MLSHDVWKNYYNRNCEVCDEIIHLREENDYHCEGCSTIMCEDCYEKVKCIVCIEMKSQDDSFESPTFCAECMQSCQVCGGATFHPFCKRFHMKTCLPGRQTKRAVVSPLEKAKNQLCEAPQGKRKLTKKEGCTKTAKKSKVVFEKRLQKHPYY